MNETKPLLPCAHCGSSAVMTNAPAYDGGPEWFNVECCKCSANVEGGYEETDAITAWNRRAPTAQAYSNGLTDGIREGQARVLKMIDESMNTYAFCDAESTGGIRALKALKQRLEQRLENNQPE